MDEISAFADVSTETLCANSPMSSSRLRQAQILGTRAFVAEEAFGALVLLMVRMQAVPASAAASMLCDVAERLVVTGVDHAVWQTNKAELELQANWLRSVAANVLECSR